MLDIILILQIIIINERNGVYINGLNEINFDFKKTTEIILVEMPLIN